MADENRLLWDHAPIGLAKVRRDGRFLAVNQGYCEITGYSESELLARTFQQITHPDDLESDTLEANNLANDGDSTSYQMVKRYIRKDGATVWVNLYVHAIREPSGEFKCYLVFAVELRNVGIYPGNKATAPPRPSASFLDVCRDNPKETSLIVLILVTIARGEDVAGLLKALFFK